MSDNGFNTDPTGYGTYQILPEIPIIIGLDTQHTEGTHILYDDRIHNPIRKEQVESVIASGVILPVILFKDKEGRLLVVDGRQRIRWSREANKFFAEQGDEIRVRVPYKLHRGSLAKALASMITVNELREDDSVIIKAKKAHAMACNGMTMDEICLAFGVTDQTVDIWLKLANTPEAMKVYTETGSAQLAYAMARQAHRTRARRVIVRPRAERIKSLISDLAELSTSPSDFTKPELFDRIRSLTMEAKDILDRKRRNDKSI